MSIHMDIVPIDWLVIIVARGALTADEITAIARQLQAADVPSYAKLIDVSSSKSELTKEEVERVAAIFRGGGNDAKRGPVAFVVNPDRTGFAEAFTDETQGERPIKLFRSLHDARRWVNQTRLFGFKSVA